MVLYHTDFYRAQIYQSRLNCELGDVDKLQDRNQPLLQIKVSTRWDPDCHRLTTHCLCGALASTERG